MIAATRLREGPVNSARGAAAFVAETIHTARASGASGLLIVRADSASKLVTVTLLDGSGVDQSDA